MISIIWIATILIPEANAWGKQGHSMTGAIAQTLLSPQAKRWISHTLDPIHNGQLSEAASWADTVRGRFPWSSHLHVSPRLLTKKYIDTEFNVTDGNQGCILNMTRDCAKNGCVVSAILDFTRVLLPSHTISSIPDVKASEALAFLVHFIGDMHNPLHVLGMDRGVRFSRGKKIDILRSRMNMHRVWDSELIGKWIKIHYNNSRFKFLDVISKRLGGEWADQARKWRVCSTDDDVVCPTDWAQEVGRLNCGTVWEGVVKNADLGGQYYETNAPVVEKLLAQAGVRIAGVLNWIVDEMEKSNRYNEL